MTDLTELRKLAEAATPGPWKTHLMDDCRAVTTDGIDIAECDAYDTDEETGAINAAFISAANPQTVLALLDRIRQLEAERDAVFDAGVEAAARVADDYQNSQTTARDAVEEGFIEDWQVYNQGVFIASDIASAIRSLKKVK